MEKSRGKGFKWAHLPPFLFFGYKLLLFGDYQKLPYNYSLFVNSSFDTNLVVGVSNGLGEHWRAGEQGGFFDEHASSCKFFWRAAKYEQPSILY